MPKEKIIGVCNICGQNGPLSFEHIPPKAAFNERPVIAVNFEKALELGPDGVVKGPVQQQGMGDHTLCGKCNNITGHWYGTRFVDWCYQGMKLLIRTNGHPTLDYLYHIFPLPILKQIITMMFSINTSEFRIPNDELVRFVLNKEAKYLSPKYRFFVYYNITGNFRSIGVSGTINTTSGKSSTMCEMSYPPIGYIMTFNSEPPDGRLIEISYFDRFDYNEFVTLLLRLPVLPTYLPIPGDYRDKNQIYREAGLRGKVGEQGGQPAAAADPHSRSHRTGSAPVLIARGAGFGQGSKRERRIAIVEFLLKCQQQSGSGQAAEPPTVGPLLLRMR